MVEQEDKVMIELEEVDIHNVVEIEREILQIEEGTHN